MILKILAILSPIVSLCLLQWHMYMVFCIPLSNETACCMLVFTILTILAGTILCGFVSRNAAVKWPFLIAFMINLGVLGAYGWEFLMTAVHSVF